MLRPEKMNCRTLLYMHTRMCMCGALCDLRGGGWMYEPVTGNLNSGVAFYERGSPHDDLPGQVLEVGVRGPQVWNWNCASIAPDC